MNITIKQQFKIHLYNIETNHSLFLEKNQKTTDKTKHSSQKSVTTIHTQENVLFHDKEKRI